MICLCDETCIKISKVQGLESFQLCAHDQVTGGWCTLTPREQFLCSRHSQTSSYVPFHLAVHLYPLINWKMISVLLSSMIFSIKINKPEEGGHGNLGCVANIVDTQVTTWTCDWHLKWGGHNLEGLSAYSVGSDFISG